MMLHFDIGLHRGGASGMPMRSWSANGGHCSMRASRISAIPSLPTRRFGFASESLKLLKRFLPGKARKRLSASSPLLANQSRRHALSNGRSEEHTSELQSLMRTSYAVFCLKKKKIHKLLLQPKLKQYNNHR